MKSVKRRLNKKARADGRQDCDSFAERLLKLGNASRSDGRPVAQVRFGQPLRSRVPAHHLAFDRRWHAPASEDRLKTPGRYDCTAKPLHRLRIVQHVLVRDAHTGLWDRTGVINGAGNFKSSLVKMPSHRLYWRNRRLLRPVRPLFPEGQRMQ